MTWRPKSLTRRQAFRLGASAAVAAATIPVAPARAAQVMKTPGVYIIEKDAFPNSVVQVETAVPAFVGHTEVAKNGKKPLHDRPWRITSMAEFHSYFGGRPAARFDLEALADDAAEDPAVTVKDKKYKLTRTEGRYILYDSMRLFFQNGGGACYIVPVGGYADALDPETLQAGIDTLVKEQEPTLLVVPDAMCLDEAGARTVQQAMLEHCGGTMRNRFAILDIWDGFRDRQDPNGDPVARFRNGLGVNYLDFAAAYYPWLETSIVQSRDVSFETIGTVDLLQSLIKEEQGLPDKKPEVADGDSDEAQAEKQKTIALFDIVDSLSGPWADETDPEEATKKAILEKELRAFSPAYNGLMQAVATELSRLPPSAAMAGIYTLVDNTRGVWTAPANVSVNAVAKPSVTITHDEQEDLNVTPLGKSINAIRSFIGEGTLVWGARTLDGNSLDWRYISVRRTMIMLEQSIQLATKAYVFAPNTGDTWVTIRSMIENFLTGIWKQGGLAGATPADAFSVQVGLGETMTAGDILEGILRVTVLVAPIRPAEFIVITFQQQMQKS